MAHHKSAIKRIRQNAAHRLHNRYYLKTMRTMIKRIRTAKEKQEAVEMLPRVNALIDKLAKRGMIHKNNAANKKSSLAKHVNALA